MTAPPKPSAEPHVYASGVAVTRVGSDFLMTFTAPLRMEETPGADRCLMLTAVATLYLSAATLKDMATVIAREIGSYEKEFGAVETAYSRSLDGARQGKAN